MPDGTTTDTPATSLDAELDLLSARIASIDLQLEAPAVIARAKGWTIDDAARWAHRARHARQCLVEDVVRLRHRRHEETRRELRAAEEIRRMLGEARSDVAMLNDKLASAQRTIADLRLQLLATQDPGDVFVRLLPGEEFPAVETLDLKGVEIEGARLPELSRRVKGVEGAAALRRALAVRAEQLAARRKYLRAKGGA